MKLFIIAILLVASNALAVPYLHPGVYADGVTSASPNPFYTTLIADNYSHTITVGFPPGGANVPTFIWYDLVNPTTGGASCKIRLMNTATKANWVAEPVPAGYTHSYTINVNTNFINYSGCSGAIFHLM